MDEPGDQPETALEAVERAEQRLDTRSRERASARERARLRKARRARYRPFLRPLGLAVLGATALVVTVEIAGGDLSGLPGPLATLIVLVELFTAPVLAARMWRSEDRLTITAVAVGVFSVELVLIFGVAFALLGLGPD